MGHAVAQSDAARMSFTGRHLTVDWIDAHRSVYDAIWLWDNSAGHRNPSNGQRLIDATDLPTDPLIEAVDSQAKVLVIRWAGSDLISQYDLGWLRNNCYCRLEPAPGGKQVVLWRAAEAPWLTRVDANEVWQSEQVRHTWLTAVALQGIAFLKRAPAREGIVLELARLVGFVRETNYGRVFNVRTLPDPNNLAYSNKGLALHTDNPYREPVPGLQMLHCISSSDTGGDSTFADGFAVADSLRCDEPDSFSILSQVPVRFSFRDRTADLSSARPLIQLDLHGRLEAIHYNSRSIAPLRLPPSDMVPFYRAYRSFARRLHTPEFLFQTRLEIGDVVLFDNRRVLHGRTEFSPAANRHLQGCYLDRDGLFSNIAVLERSLETQGRWTS